MSDFPLCQLHGTRIVSEFPPGCATGMPGREAALRIAEMQGAGYWRGQGDPAPHVAMARAADVCMACQSTLRADLHVRFLREQATDA